MSAPVWTKYGNKNLINKSTDPRDLIKEKKMPSEKRPNWNLGQSSAIIQR